jgi:hypothetical protein
MSSGPEALRAARNESIFRELNDHLEAASAAEVGDRLGFVCECADIACAEMLTVPLEEYERVRADSQRFIVAPGDAHVNPAVERIVARHDGFWVVEKIGLAGDVAEALDGGP